MASINLEDLISQLESTLKLKLGRDFEERFKVNLLEELKVNGKSVLLSAFVKQYDLLVAREKSEYGPLVRNSDPSSLEKFRDLFIEQTTKELDSIRIEGDLLLIEIGNKALWGFGREDAPEGPPTSVDILVYYLEGVVGEFGFLSIDHYQMRRKRVAKVGRFGEGFLISKEDYEEEGWERITNIKFEEIRHPISGQPPFKGFDTIAGSLDFSLFVKEATRKTLLELL